MQDNKITIFDKLDDCRGKNCYFAKDGMLFKYVEGADDLIGYSIANCGIITSEDGTRYLTSEPQGEPNGSLCLLDNDALFKWWYDKYQVYAKTLKNRNWKINKEFQDKLYISIVCARKHKDKSKNYSLLDEGRWKEVNNSMTSFFFDMNQFEELCKNPSFNDVIEEHIKRFENNFLADARVCIKQEEADAKQALSEIENKLDSKQHDLLLLNQIISEKKVAIEEFTAQEGILKSFLHLHKAESLRTEILTELKKQQELVSVKDEVADKRSISYVMESYSNLNGRPIKDKDKSIILMESISEAIKHTSKYIYHKRMILQPSPDWMSHACLWNSGFCEIFQHAVSHHKEGHVVIIQNYNMALADAYLTCLINFSKKITTHLPLADDCKQFPDNLLIIIVPIAEISDDESKMGLECSKYIEDNTKYD